MADINNEKENPTPLRIVESDRASSSMAAPVDPPISEGVPAAKTTMAQQEREQEQNGSEDEKEARQNSGQEEESGESEEEEEEAAEEEAAEEKAWMYEAILVLAKAVGRIRALVVKQTFSRMLRWHDQKWVVHPFLTGTEGEAQQHYVTSFRALEDQRDEGIDRLTRDLQGVTHGEKTPAAQEQREESSNGSEDEKSGDNSGQDEDSGENSGQDEDSGENSGQEESSEDSDDEEEAGENEQAAEARVLSELICVISGDTAHISDPNYKISHQIQSKTMADTHNDEHNPMPLRILDSGGASSSMAGRQREEMLAALEQMEESSNDSEESESGDNSGQEEDFSENSGQEDSGEDSKARIVQTVNITKYKLDLTSDKGLVHPFLTAIRAEAEEDYVKSFNALEDYIRGDQPKYGHS
ncbi:FK506-binding protein 5-like [Pistacia vera]|uniref:FK506-binding protein 5-like n=1 Tax=Pistacia vera TaxID=55513 RepID=UPI001263BA0D|nr:FK506-binding protein 5-like [Pistacia vera]